MSEQDISEKNTWIQKEDLGMRILINCRNRLYASFPYLDGAFACIDYRCDPSVKTIGTDGDVFYFAPDYLLKKYRENPDRVTRGYLHMLLHCLYLHCFPDQDADEHTWDLACDIAAELIIEKEKPKGLELPENPDRKRFIQSFAGRTPSADHIYSLLTDGRIRENTETLAEWFRFDDHMIGRERKNAGERKQTKQKWEKILAFTGARQQDHQKKRGEQKGSAEEEIRALKKKQYDYRIFLKKFAVPREEMEIDQESFDYIFYNLGMETYGDMPLIEPLEYREVNKLEELVIAIDTSGSCDTDTVKKFLSETYGILSDKENFFKKMKVYLIQCDCCIQEVNVIHSEEEWAALNQNFRIQGRGGTDFRPVFEYVDKLRKTKELRRLKALIYFTDGDGIYPREKPEYETAFVFVKEHIRQNHVPDWALRLTV